MKTRSAVLELLHAHKWKDEANLTGAAQVCERPDGTSFEVPLLFRRFRTLQTVSSVHK